MHLQARTVAIYVCRDPTDPTKFFQQQDSSFQDAVALCTLVAVLYLVFQAFTELEKIS